MSTVRSGADGVLLRGASSTVRGQAAGEASGADTRLLAPFPTPACTQPAHTGLSPASQSSSLPQCLGPCCLLSWSQHCEVLADPPLPTSPAQLNTSCPVSPPVPSTDIAAITLL